MRSLICFLLLQLSFSVYGADAPEWLTKNLDYPYQAVRFHFTNKSDEKCTLTNKLHHISFWGEDYEPHPITLRAGEEFEGYLRFYDELLQCPENNLGLQLNDRFAIEIGHDVFELRFVSDLGVIFPRLYIVDNNEQRVKATQRRDICGRVAVGDSYKVTQIFSYRGAYESTYYIVINDKRAPEEQRIAAPTEEEQKYITARQVAMAAQTTASEKMAGK